jgi:gliding motility-associated-like protein
MKKTLNKFSLLILTLLASQNIFAQAFGPIVCPINAGADQTICAPNCANLTGTFVATALPGTGANAYVQSTIPYAPDPYNAGTAVALFDDQWSQVINIPFSFCYYGNTYNQCLIGSNGVVSFNLGTAGGYCTWPIPATNAPSNTYGFSNVIMGPWQDLNPSVGGSVRYATYGTAPCRRFVVSWFNVPMYSCGNPTSQQIILYETTNVIDNFIQNRFSCGWNSNRAIQGVMNNGGTQAVVTPGRNATNAGWTTANDGKRYTPNGASNYVVGWYQGATLINAGATATVCPTTTTTYTFQATYTNCNGQTVTVSDQMIVTASSLIVTASPNTSICSGSNTTLTANAVAAITWQWTTLPTNAVVANTQNATVSPTVTTSFVVTATDASGCQGKDTVLVTVTQMTTADAGPNDTVCANACTNLTASGGVTYLWTADPSLVGALNSATIQACPSVTTQYYCTVTDAAGCIGVDSVTVFVAPVVLSVNALATPANCFGSCDGTASAAANGGYPPYSYSWSNSSTGANINALCAGGYTVTVTDAIGCTATASVTVTEPTALDVQSTNITTANCGQNDGSVTISISGGVPNYTILWPSGGNGLTESNLAPGQVCVTVTDANGCDTVVCFNVPNTPGAATSISAFTNVTCFSACDGTASATTVGGTAPYNYSWNTVPAQNTANATGICPGTYTVTMTDGNGCIDTSVVTITEPPQLTVAASGTATICIGQSTALNALANGGTPGYTYAWTDGTNAWATQSPSVSPVVTTTYTVVVTDANGCISAPSSVTITVNPPLQVNAMATLVVCQNTNVNLTAAGAGGNGNLTYNWMPGNLNGASVSIVATTSQQYTVTVSDNCGTPVATDTVSVLINPAPVPSFTTTNATSGCEDLCVQFVNSTPNTASLTWTFGNNLGTSTSSPATFCFNDAGSYDVTLFVTDVIGCSGTTTMSNYVTVWPLPQAAFSANPQPATLLNNTVQFTDLSVGANEWIWSFGVDDSASVLQNPSYTFGDTGVFAVQLIVTNSYGCQDSVTLPVIVQEDYALFIPNTFTPDGDGINDLFFPQGIGVDPANYQMYIFDRWGNQIYVTSAWPGGWDGTVQGSSRLCQIDTYVYKITTADPNGAKKVYIGHVNLIR